MEYYKMTKPVEYADLEHFQYPNRRIGVIVHIVDDNGKILLQQRETKSRDENGYQRRIIQIRDFGFDGTKLPTEEEIQSYKIPKQYILK